MDLVQKGRPSEQEEAMKTVKYIAPWLAAAAIGGAIAVAPIASADVSVQQHPGNAQVTASPRNASHEAAQLQQPFGGDMGALLFHH